MGLFNRRDKIIDLTEKYRDSRKTKPKEGLETPSSGSASAQNQETSQGSFFNFFGNSSPSSSSSSVSSSSGVASSDNSNTSETLDADEKRRRLAKRLKDMTDRIEEQANQIYILQQRIELLEKKSNADKYE